jgi:hypothetical protein
MGLFTGTSGTIPNTLPPSTLVTPLVANSNASTTVARSANPGNASSTSPSSSSGANTQHTPSGQVGRRRHQVTSNSTPARRSQYVELCVNTGQLCQSLAEIDVTARAVPLDTKRIPSSEELAKSLVLPLETCIYGVRSVWSRPQREGTHLLREKRSSTSGGP